MSTDLTAAGFLTRLEALQSDDELHKIQRYFKTGDGQYGEGDVFIGVKMGSVFDLAKQHLDMPVDQLEALLESPIHEARAGALSIMGKSATHKKATAARKQELFELYMRRHDRVNSWDLVDLGALYVVGPYLLDKPREILYTLARSDNVWERRTAIVSTAAFIRKGETADTFAIAELLLNDSEDLVHKGTGWMLRAAGEADRPRLAAFLELHATAMPRTLLRYAIEKFEKAERERYLSMKKHA
jgi:3-methyladenine DNA glycosylase AlkD